ncbi:MAG: TIM barrel protein [Candidatus Latescibacteria bacterium]|nr:TIM barrel protein [Candidatus Latescibacterota bacterium]
MIKLSTMARETPTASIEEVIEQARRMDLDGVDLHLSGMDRSIEYMQRVKVACLKHGLNIGYAGAGSFVGPPEDRAQRMQQGRADVDAAAFLGAQVVRAFARHKWPDTVEEQEVFWGPMIEDFQEICDYAAQRGVMMAVQNHDNGSFAMTAAQVLRILGETDRANFSFLMDTGQWLGAIGSHPRGEFDANVDLYKDYLEPTAPHTTYVRAKIYKIESGVEEFIDYQRVLQILRGVDFNGTIGLVFELGEFNTCSQEECVALAVRHLRQVIGARS